MPQWDFIWNHIINQMIIFIGIPNCTLSSTETANKNSLNDSTRGSNYTAVHLITFLVRRIVYSTEAVKMMLNSYSHARGLNIIAPTILIKHILPICWLAARTFVETTCNCQLTQLCWVDPMRVCIHKKKSFQI